MLISTFLQLFDRRAATRVKSDTEHVVHNTPPSDLWNTLGAIGRNELITSIYANTRNIFAADILRQRRENGAFPFQLDTLAFLAQFGGLSDVWEQAPFLKIVFERTRQTFEKELVAPSGAAHICTRATLGALALGTGSQLPEAHYTMHMQAWPYVPFVQGSPATFVHERPFPATTADASCLSIAQRAHSISRGMIKKGLPSGRKSKLPVRFYGSLNVGVDESTIERSQQEAILHSIEAQAQADLGQAVEFRMGFLEEAPKCVACEW